MESHSTCSRPYSYWEELVYLFRYGQRIAFQILKTSRIVPEPEIAAQEIASTSYYKCLESNAVVRNFKAYYSTVIRRESNRVVNKYHRLLGLDWNTSHSNPTLEFEDKEQQIPMTLQMILRMKHFMNSMLNYLQNTG